MLQCVFQRRALARMLMTTLPLALVGAVIPVDAAAVQQDVSADPELDSELWTQRFFAVANEDALARPAAEKIPLYRELLADASKLDQQTRDTIANRAIWLAVQLSNNLTALGRIQASLECARQQGQRWSNATLDWRTALALREARALQWLGMLDEAEQIYVEAIELVEEALSNELTNGVQCNVGGYFNAYAYLIQFKLHLNQRAEALSLLDSLEQSIDWEWVASRIPRDKRLAEKARLSWLRGSIHAADDSDDGAKLARELFREVATTPEANWDVRIPASIGLAWLDLEIGSESDIQRTLQLLKTLRSEALAAGFDRSHWFDLSVASIAASAPADEDTRAQRVRELWLSLDRVHEVVRQNPMSNGQAVSRFQAHRSATEVLLNATSAESWLRSLLKLQSVGRLWNQLAITTPIAADVRRALCGKGRGALVYLRGRSLDRWFVLAPDGSESVFELPPIESWSEPRVSYQSQLRVAPDRLPTGLREKRPAALARSASKIADTLFPGELRRALESWDTIYFVGREELQGLAIESLPVVSNEALGCTHAIIDLPSLALAPHLTQPVARRSDRLQIGMLMNAAIDDAVADQYSISADLGLSTSKLVGALAFSDGWRIRVRDGSGARVGAMTRDDGEDALHLWVHGVTDPYRQSTAMLALAPHDPRVDGLVELEAVRNLQCAQLVLLSVCSGADSPPRTGDPGSNHFGGAFLEAGAKTVVFSAGEVRLNASVEFHKHLYAGLRSGSNVARAVRDARKSLADSTTFGDPFYWGLIRVFGGGR